MPENKLLIALVLFVLAGLIFYFVTRGKKDDGVDIPDIPGMPGTGKFEKQSLKADWY